MFVDNFIWQKLSFNEYALWSLVPFVGQRLVKTFVLANKLNGICGFKTKPHIGYSFEGFFKPQKMAEMVLIF